MKVNRINEKKFNRLTLLTIIAVYLVILAGGIVRSTGSGMGCPDWPRCFGSWIPPTSESQLPEDYQQKYAEIRVAKNQDLAAYLEFFGFNGLSDDILAESVAAPEASFNKFKTWTEYINRLLGAALGVLISILAVRSLSFRKSRPEIFYASITALVLVVFQGWIGSVVVSTNLLPGMVTFHMILAALLIGILIKLFHTSASAPLSITDKSKSILTRVMLLVAMVLLLVQIAVGTQVREAIDVVALELGQTARNQWINNLGSVYYIHRAFSLVLLAACAYTLVLLKQTGNRALGSMANLMLLFIAIEVGLGITMAYLGVPPWAQPLHLLMALLVLGLLYLLYLKTKSAERA